MRRLSFALTTLLLLSPLAASAAYTTPAALIAQMYSGSPRAFSFTVHARTPDNLYVSIWSKGSIMSMNEAGMEFSANATIDVVYDTMKLRLKCEVMTVDGMSYIKITNMDTSMKHALASFSGNLQQHVWLEMPTDLMAQNLLQNLTLAAAEEIDDTFDMTSEASKNGVTYTLTLTPSAAMETAVAIRELLHDESSVSDDFFPWEALAKSIDFSMVVTTDANDTILNQSLTLHKKGANSSFSFTSTEKPTPAVTLKAPAGSMSLDEIGSFFGQSTPTYEEDITSYDENEWTDDETMSDFDVVDDGISASCEDPSISALQMLSLQRDGTCPVQKTPTRYTR